MLLRLIIILILASTFSKRITKEHPPLFVVWDVGQGAWSSLIINELCLHFDMGGETPSTTQALKYCRNRNNQILITHEDWDHINVIRKWQKLTHNTCLYYPRPKIRRHLKHMPQCSKPPFIKVISRGKKNGTRNESSFVYLVANQILITGDAPRSEENKWLHKLPTQLQGLLLGHHGSQTSTSKKLLNRVSFLWSVASSRKKKYGHPHRKVLNRAQAAGIPVLQTEQLGHIYFVMDFKSFESMDGTPYPNQKPPLHMSPSHRRHSHQSLE